MKKLIYLLSILSAVLWGTGCAKKVVETDEYTTFYYKSYGAPFTYVYECLIDFEKKTLETKYAETMYEFNEEKYQTETITLTDEQITELQKALNSADVKNWKKQYNPDVPMCDGTFCKGYYKLKDGREGFIRGNNAWPNEFEYISIAITATGSKFYK
jgi:hypothetical protein